MRSGINGCATLRVCVAGMAMLCGSLGSVSAWAAPLGLSEVLEGDVTTHYTAVSYDAGTGNFLASGYPDGFFHGNLQNILFDGGNSFLLQMTVNPATGALVSGSVSISGENDGIPSYSGLLLSGTITQFGFPVPGPSFGGGNIFEFVVNVTGGALLPDFYASHTAGIIMNIANGTSSPSFTGDFTTSFQNDGLTGLGGFSDTFPMAATPEPQAFVLLALGLIPLALRSRWSRRHPAC